jgi:uncharacterized RDD family membrane protein YckC/Tfp pilus assembly major pilin PilA
MSSISALPAVIPLYAGFWRRAAAFILDGVILVLPNAMIGWYLGSEDWMPFGISILLGCAYYAGFHSSAAQATPGKMAMRVKVTNLAGGRIGLGRGIVRYFATWLSAIILGLGYLLAAVTRKRQALHDMIAGTVVVNRKAAPAEVVAGGGVMPVTAGVWAAIVLVLLFPFIAGVVAAVAIPAYQDYLLKAKVTDVLATSAPLKAGVEQALVQKVPFTAGTTTALSQYAQSIEVTPEGEIVIRLGSASGASAARISWVPTVDAAGKVSWKCAIEGLAQRYLPSSCRG